MLIRIFIKKIIVAAVCSRPYVQAARKAGYEVIAIDVFADADTQRVAQQVFKVAYFNGGFVASEIEQILAQLDLTEVAGFVYGSGFESQPDLLARISLHLPLVGNQAAVVSRLKCAPQFFALLDLLNIQHPDVSFNLLEDATGWLQKHAGGSGGTHVTSAFSGIEPVDHWYYQRVVEGIPVSILFVANGSQIDVIGFNQQLVAPTPDMPYRYGGVVGHADLSNSIKQQLLTAAQDISDAVGLRGLNSIDGIVQGDSVWILEVNPRLSATFDLYQCDEFNLFDIHLQASMMDLVALPQIPSRARAQHVLYAPCDIVVDGRLDWPEWVADVPVLQSYVASGSPLCTVLAAAENAEDARLLVLARVNDAMIEFQRAYGWM